MPEDWCLEYPAGFEGLFEHLHQWPAGSFSPDLLVDGWAPALLCYAALTMITEP